MAKASEKKYDRLSTKRKQMCKICGRDKKIINVKWKTARKLQKERSLTKKKFKNRNL